METAKNINVIVTIVSLFLVLFGLLLMFSYMTYQGHNGIFVGMVTFLGGVLGLLFETLILNLNSTKK